jgi:LuxR family transcriptional regulator, maltose regulon positive regulatory protein
VSAPNVAGTNPLIERRRVGRRLAASAAHSVTIVLAPAGCGKSVALQHHLSALDVPYVRYDVRPEHGNLLGFVRGLADVVQAVAPAARGTVASAVAGALASDAPESLLAPWMSNHLADFSGVIAIDDFHHTDPDSRCALFLAALVERTKSHTRWIVASRSARHLPISSWIVYGDAAIPIDESDLRFTPDEAQEAARASRSSLETGDVDRLLETTAGWATAFTLALRVSEYSPDVQSAAAAARQLSYEYLAEHVYRTLTAEERALLAIASILPDMDVEVLEKAGFDRAHVVLSDLQRRATFLSAIPNEPGAPALRRYRCHDLFRDFLAHELELQGEEASDAAHLRAARALSDCGRTIQALRLYTKMHAAREILALLAAHGFELAEQAHGDAVTAAIDALPETDRNANPVAVGLRAQIERAAGRYDRAQVLYERAIAACTDRHFTATLVAKLGGALLSMNKNPAESLEPMAFDRTLPPALRGELLSLLGVSYARFDQHDGLDRLLEDIETLALDVDSDMTRAQILHQLGTAAFLHGDSERATRALTRAAELATANGMFRLASLVYTSLGSNAEMNDNDRPKALIAAQNAGDAALKAGEFFPARYALARQIDIEVHRGDDQRLHELLRSYAELPGPDHPQLHKATLWARAMLAAWEGRFEEAAGLQIESCQDQPFQEDRILAKAACALFLLGANRRDEALAYVQASLADGKGGNAPRPSLARAREIARALSALTEALAGRTTAANRLLQKKARAETPVTNALFETVRVILRSADGSRAIEQLAPQFATLERHWFGGYARLFQMLLRAHDAAHSISVKLTPAELSVLRSLADGRAPKEIALELGCSVHTVRWHIRQIVTKFGCSGREQALRAAQSHGFL